MRLHTFNELGDELVDVRDARGILDLLKRLLIGLHRQHMMNEGHLRVLPQQ